MKLVWSPRADEQVDEVFVYIAADDAAAARRWLEQLLEQVRTLRRFPDSGRVVPELGRDDIRELIVGSYRVIYRRREDLVEIAAIRHHARHFDEDELTR
ncbi:MAG TPA: type II toxin-antitoxin system RelE/ParE family toxin [Coriobacteriia bacterium]